MNPQGVYDFPSLIRWIADKHHDGAVHPIHRRVGVSAALVQLWVNGSVKNPSLDYLERLCAAYSLDFDWVRSLLRKPRPVLSGGSGAKGYYVNPARQRPQPVAPAPALSPQRRMAA